MGQNNRQLVSRPVLNKHSGFTFIEIIVVVMILGVLAAWITPNYNNSIKSARDARRKSDLRAIEQALSLYYDDYQEYPESQDGMITVTTPINWGDSFTVDSVTYSEALPKDPKTGLSYYYERIDTNTYTLEAILERPGEDEGSACSYLTGGICYHAGEVPAAPTSIPATPTSGAATIEPTSIPPTITPSEPPGPEPTFADEEEPTPTGIEGQEP